MLPSGIDNLWAAINPKVGDPMIIEGKDKCNFEESCFVEVVSSAIMAEEPIISYLFSRTLEF